MDTIRAVCERYGQAVYYDSGDGYFAVRQGPSRLPKGFHVEYHWYKWDTVQGHYVMTGSTNRRNGAKEMFLSW